MAITVTLPDPDDLTPGALARWGQDIFPELIRAVVELQGEVGPGANVAWADIDDVPPELTAAPAAGTAGIRAIGATATTVIAGNDSRLTAGAAGVATVRAIGTTATTAAAGNDARLMAGAAVAQVNSVAADVPALVVDFNALLAKLRTRGVIAP